jgi:uncharacterized protein YjbI with pentapeptide repeats
MSSHLEKTDQEPERSVERTPNLSPRGRYWEVTYQKSSPTFDTWTLTKTALDDEKASGKDKVKVNTEPETRGVNLKSKHFHTCDFNHFALDDSSFYGCTFVNCLFVKSDFSHVKFSKCRFETCHFLNVKFQNCQFLDCEFAGISASAEQVYFISSSLLASKFVDALSTNLSTLPENTEASYQQYRLLKTKAKIAGRILIGLRDEPEPSILSDANRTFEIALQNRQIAEARWIDNGQKLGDQNYWSQFVVVPFRETELKIMRIAGFFTDWGSSPIKSGWFLIGAFVLFSAAYWLAFGKSLDDATLRALDCTLVFGYSNYPRGLGIQAIDWVMFLNALAGLWWYGLFVPALTKRIFR